MLSAGQSISHYRLLAPIGKGGMGEVYLAEDTLLERKVALKFLQEGLQQNPEARKRFLREARAAAALDHPFICRVYDTGEEDGKAFIVMEYVPGETLRKRLARSPLTFKEALHVAKEIAEALEEAHSKRIVHRDLKPANIMLMPSGHAKVMDFGLAKQLASPGTSTIDMETQGTDLTQAGHVLGTVAYMSPEQARSQPVDSRSDIFSFGVVLFEMMSGSNPFMRASEIETLTAILRDPAPELHMEAKAPVPAVRAILRKALAKDLSERYQSTKEMAIDLAALESGLTPPKWPASVMWILAAAALLVIVLIAVTFRIENRGPRPQAAARATVAVLIADFQNRTGDPILDGTLEPKFAEALEGTPFLTARDRGKAREIGRQLQPGAAGLNETLAQLVAKREGIHAVVTGEIDRRGNGYRLSVRAIDATNGRQLVTRAGDAADKQGILALVKKLAAPLRKALGDTAAESAQLAAGETFTASSLEAAHNYALAQECQWVGKEEEEIRYYELAIQLDPDFGRAYAGLALVYANRGQLAEAEKYYRMAMQRIDRMTDREKYRTRGGYYLMVSNYPKAIEEFRELVRQYPADTAGAYNLALALFQSRDISRALQEVRKVAAQDPNNLFYQSNAASFATYAGDFEGAARQAQSVLQANSTYHYAFVPLALAQLAQGRPVEAAETYRRLGMINAYGASVAAHGLADIAMYEGRLSEASRILEKGIAGDMATKNTEAAAAKSALLAQLRLQKGNRAAALEAAGRAIRGSKGYGVMITAARVFIEMGMEREALALSAQLAARLEPDPQAYARLIEGELNLKRRDVQAALRLLHEAQKLSDTWIGRFDLGRAYLEAGAFTEAHSEFDLCRKRSGEATAVFLDDLPSYACFPPVYYYLGRAQEGLKSPGAAESYRTYIAIKEKGEQDSLLSDARRRLASF